jgi:hypothetical protein
VTFTKIANLNVTVAVDETLLCFERAPLSAIGAVCAVTPIGSIFRSCTGADISDGSTVGVSQCIAQNQCKTQFLSNKTWSLK